MPQYFATTQQTQTAYTCNGTAINGSASASASSSVSYEDALIIATEIAQNLALQNAEASVKVYEECNLQLISYSALAEGTGRAVTKNGLVIDTNATATATSTVSELDAYNTALQIANNVAQTNADNDVKLLNEITSEIIINNISAGNMKLELVEPNGSYELNQPSNANTAFIIISPKQTPNQILTTINNTNVPDDQKIYDIDYNIHILNNGVEIFKVKAVPIIYTQVNGIWYNVVYDYVVYILQALGALTNSDLTTLNKLYN